MGNVTIRLGLAERQIINRLLATRRDGTLTAARNVAELRSTLKLRDAAKEIDAWQEEKNEHVKLMVAEVQRLVKAYNTEADEVVKADLLAQLVTKRLELESSKITGAPTWDDLLDSGKAEDYGVSEPVLRSLNDMLQAHDWGKQWDGEKEKSVTVSPDQLEAVVILDKAIAAALATKAE